MKTTNTVLLLIAFCLVTIVLPINARISEVVYNNPEHTSGSLTLLASDCSDPYWQYDWLITVPTNTPIKVSVDLNYFVYLEVFSNAPIYQEIFYSDEPAQITKTIISSDGKIYINSEDFYGESISSNAFTITFEVDGTYTSNENLNVLGNVTVGTNLDVYGAANIVGAANFMDRLSIGSSYNVSSKLYVFNNKDSRAINVSSNKQSTTPTYGMYSSATNYSGNTYGIYSSVSGVSGKRWSGYFTGGDVEISGGILRSKHDIIIGAGNNQYIFSTQYWKPNNPPEMFIAPKISTTSEWDWSKQIILNHEGSILITGGKLGVGTTQIPDSFKLAVAGKIIAEEVVVKLQSNWPDYVFKPTYELMPLHQVEQFVQANNHLPGIPSAAEVKNDGLSMGEMQNKLLQKIEELTLYMIEQDKKITNLEERLK